MKIKIDLREIIPLEDFELKWRWSKTHNQVITDTEINSIRPVSKEESTRLNRIIQYFENEENLKQKYKPSEWISANSENAAAVDNFRKVITSILEPWTENVIVTWNRKTTITTTKEILIKYWDDFLYPGSDDVTVISEQSNWVIIYKHFGVANIWTKHHFN